MDKSAVGHDYVAKVEKHGSQTDAAKGFGGKFGVQTDRVDKVTKFTAPQPSLFFLPLDVCICFIPTILYNFFLECRGLGLPGEVGEA